jgi:hypothetical protein
MLINTADQIYLGDQSVSRVYQGDVLVWPSESGNTLSAALTKIAGQAKVRCTVSYDGTDPDEYKYWLSVNGGAYQLKGTTAATTFDMSTTYSSKNRAKVESLKNGLLITTALTNEVTTDAAPPPPTKQKTVTLSRVEWGTWRGNGTQRYYNSNALYSGYFSGTNGNQRSSARFNIPGDLRNCKSVDKVEFSAWNDHAYNGDLTSSPGRTVWLAVHHYGDLNSANGIRYGSTAPFASFRAAKRDAWVGGAQWVDITNYVCPGRYSVKEEFRRWGAQGLHFHQAPNNSQAHYGYVRNDVRLRITYTVYT